MIDLSHVYAINSFLEKADWVWIASDIANKPQEPAMRQPNNGASIDRTRWPLCACLFLLTFLLATRAWSDDFIEKRLRTEAPQAWKEYADAVAGLQGKSSLIVWEKGSVHMRHNYEFRHSGDCALCIREVLVENGKQAGQAQLVCVNPAYGFRIIRSAPDTAWKLVKLIRPEDFQALHPHPKFLIALMLSRPYVPSYFGGIRDNLLASNSVLKVVKPHKEAGQSFVRVEFRYALGSEGNKEYYKDGWVDLDPSQYWLIRKGACTTVTSTGPHQSEPGDRGRVELEYTLLDGRWPVLRKQTLWSEFVRDGRVFIVEETFEFWKEPRPSEAEFRLSYYGLPEPQGLSWPKPTPWWLYMILSGLALVALGLAIYAYGRWRLQRTFAA